MKLILILALSMILTACGGGGGGSAPAPVATSGHMPVVLSPVDRIEAEVDMFCASHGKNFAHTPMQVTDKDYPAGLPAGTVVLDGLCVDGTRYIMGFDQTGERIR